MKCHACNVVREGNVLRYASSHRHEYPLVESVSIVLDRPLSDYVEGERAILGTVLAALKRNSNKG